MTDDLENLNDTYPGAGTFMFGHDRKSCEQQLALVRGKTKTAMWAPASEFVDDPASMPKVGRCDIATEWDGTPAVVIKTVKVTTLPFDQVTPQMAYDDGVMSGGERETLTAWRKAQQIHLKANGGFDPKMPLVFEHFELIEDLSHRLHDD